MFRFILALCVTIVTAYNIKNVGIKLSKAVGIASLTVGLSMPVLADGASSQSSVYRARIGYGNRILGLGEAASSGKFEAFDCKLTHLSISLY
jgi:hypothetical protein